MKRLIRILFGVTVLLVSLLVVAVPKVSGFQSETPCALIETVAGGVAPTDGPSLPGDSDIDRGQGDASVTIVVERCDVGLSPNQPAETDYVAADSAGATVTVSEPGRIADNCVETAARFSSDPDVTYPLYCVKWRVCGGERVDDVVSGEIAGAEADGKYRSYLDQMVGLLDAAIDLGPAASPDALESSPGSVSDFLLEQGPAIAPKTT